MYRNEWFLRGLAVEALDGLATTEGRHFVEQSIKLLLRSKTKHEEGQSLTAYLRGQGSVFLRGDDGRYLLMPSSKEQLMQQHLSSRDIGVIGDVIQDYQNPWEGFNVFGLQALDELLLSLDDTL